MSGVHQEAQAPAHQPLLLLLCLPPPPSLSATQARHETARPTPIYRISEQEQQAVVPADISVNRGRRPFELAESLGLGQ
eukprot:COSAG01_NODE_52777_length_344_cov_0.742857_1_plen_78_part_01